MARCKELELLRAVALSGRGRNGGGIRVIISGENWQLVRHWAGPALLIIIALAGAAHLWLRTGEYGLGLTNDSLHYLAAAASLADGNGLQSAAGGPFLLYTPLYPMALAGISRLGIEPVAAAQVVNIAAFGLLTLLVGLWLRRRVKYGLIAGAGALTVMAAAPLINTASYLWSETLFALLILLSLLQLEAFLKRPERTRTLAAAAACAGLAAVTRYMGVAAILAGVLLILAIPKLPARVRLAYAAAYGAAASIPLAAYMARNYAVSGSWIVSPNRDAAYTTGDALRDLAGGALRYLQIADAPAASLPGLFWAGVGLTALAATAGVLLYFRLARKGAAAGRDTAPGLRTSLAPALPFAVFAAAYVAIMLVVVSDRAAQSIDSRYLMPIVPPLLLAAALLADRVLQIEARGGLAALKWLATAMALLFWLANLAYETRSGLADTATARASGYIGDTYNTAQWRDTETAAYLKAHPVAGPVYTNHAGRLWWFADVEQRKITVKAPAGADCPAWLRRAMTEIERDDDAARHDYPYIIWFDRRAQYRNWCDFEPDALPPGLERLALFDDGAVYRVGPSP